MRKFRGWTQDELANRAHMDTKSLGAIERGERNVTLENVSKISKGLNVEIQQLFLFAAKALRPDEEVSEEKILDAIRVASPSKKALMLGILNEVLAFDR